MTQNSVRRMPYSPTLPKNASCPQKQGFVTELTNNIEPISESGSYPAPPEPRLTHEIRSSEGSGPVRCSCPCGFPNFEYQELMIPFAFVIRTRPEPTKQGPPVETLPRNDAPLSPLPLSPQPTLRQLKSSLEVTVETTNLT